MTVQLQRPLVIGGIGLTLGLWGLDSVFHSLSGLGDILTIGAAAAGGGYWWYSQQGKTTAIAPASLDRPGLDRVVHQVELTIERLKVESGDSSQIEQLQHHLAQAQTNLSRTARHIAITGGRNVGKSALMQLLTTAPVPSTAPLRYIETPALFTVEADRQTINAQTQGTIVNADLVLFMINGDLTATEYNYLSTLNRSPQRVILLLNQIDRYLPDERTLMLQKLKSTLDNTLAPQDIIATSTAPAPIKVRKIQLDGSTVESMETAPIELASFTSQLTNILATESEKLVLATAYRQTVAVQTVAKAALNSIRRGHALPMIDQNQWIVATAAFANPLPALDLLATAAVNAQMVIDLGGIYQQKFSLEHAQAASGAIGTAIFQLGLVEICTQTVAGLLKTNAVTYMAGGLVQGLSAAYLTRIAGLTLIEYFEAQDLLNPEPTRAWNFDLLTQTLQRVFQANQRVAYLQTIFKQGVDKLVPQN